MSGAGSQVAPIGPDGSSGRSPLAHLLHALNQPLTGLQCSMELALAGPRPTDHYLRTLSEGLQLVSRMRLLVEALREIADLQAPATTERAAILLDNLLREAGRELQPVAESKDVRLFVETSAPLPVRADIGRLTALLFRVIDCAISLSAKGSALHIEAICDRSTHHLLLGPGATAGEFSLFTSRAWTPGCAGSLGTSRRILYAL